MLGRGERHGSWQTAQHIGGKAWTRQDKGARRRDGCSDDVVEEEAGAAFDSLGGDDDRKARQYGRREDGQNFATSLGRNSEDQRFAIGNDSGIAIPRPDFDIVTGFGCDKGQGAAPGAVPGNGDPAHALTPAPGAGSADGSSGQRGRAGASRGSMSPSARRSAPAQAIIAALSVHNAGGGTFNAKP